MTLNYGALPNLVPNLATDDVAQGLNEWRNIQRIVRTTFKALHDALQAQAETIRSLQEAVGSKAPASDTARRLDGVEAALRRKLDAGADDFVRRDELKACYDYHRGHIESLQKNFDSTASSLEKDLRGKVDFESLTAKLEGFATSVELSKALQSKAERAEVEGLLEGKCDKSTQEICDKELRSEIFDVRSDLNRAFQELATHKADAKDLQSLESAVTRAGSHSAASADSLGERLASLEAAMDSSSKELLSHGERAAALHKQVSELALKVEACEAAQADAGRKADAEEVGRMLRQKADLTEVREALSCKANTAAVERLFERVERQERGGKDMASALDRIWEDLRAKAGSGQLGALLDAKANVDDVNHALAEVSSQLEQKASASALDELQRAQWQAASSPLLSNDNCIGRWIWRSGRTKAGGAVPWNVQSVNCDPQNLKWEKDRSSIVVVSAGMYEVMLGFFSNRKPTVQLHVNGEPVLAAVSTSESVLNRSTGHLATLGRYASGNTAGLSLVDFLLLPQRAKITVTYSGDEAGEGFISLKRL